MRKLFLILLLSFSFAVDPFAFIPTDKVLHVGASYVIVDALETQLEFDWFDSLFAIWFIGLIKEQIDVNSGGSWDNGDIVANGVGYVLYRLIHFEYKF